MVLNEAHSSRSNSSGVIRGVIREAASRAASGSLGVPSGSGGEVALGRACSQSGVLFCTHPPMGHEDGGLNLGESRVRDEERRNEMAPMGPWYLAVPCWVLGWW